MRRRNADQPLRPRQYYEKKQSFEAVTKFGKVVSGQDMDAAIDMKRHD